MKTTDFYHWLAGFADGEASFTIGEQTKGKYKFYGVRFAIRLRDDDVKILEECLRKTKVGRLVRRKTIENKKTGIISKPSVTWQVSGWSECKKICDIFSEHPLRSKKKRDFEIWKKAVITVLETPKGNRHSGENRYKKVGELAKKLVSVRNYENAGN